MSCVLREFPSSTYNKYVSDENSCAALLIEINLIPEPETAKFIINIQFGRANVDRSRIKNRILVQIQGGTEFQPADILKYFEELELGSNTETCPPLAGWDKRLF
jgi:hypothetical protein